MDQAVKILMVTPYPPLRDGIATYAVQQVRQLRAQGHDVEVLSPEPSAAHHHLNTRGGRGALALAKIFPQYDKVIIQYHPDFFFLPWSTERGRAKIAASLAYSFSRAREIEIVAHELSYLGSRKTPEGIAFRAMWRRANRVLVHTTGELESFVSAFGYPRERVELMAHGESFTPATRYDREAARKSLGIAEGELVFLCIGFIQAHKGFDRAAKAFAGLHRRNARLDIVGAVRIDDPGYLAYADELDELVAKTPGARFHRGYVSDELFDRWILASDCVVLPYREIFSSGVLERARLFGRPVIVSDVGGLNEQASDMSEATLFTNDDELRTAMWSAATPATHEPRVRRPWEATAGESLHASVQAEVIRRAEAVSGVVAVESPTSESRPGC